MLPLEQNNREVLRMAKQVFNVRMDIEDINAIERKAKDNNMSVSQYARNMLLQDENLPVDLLPAGDIEDMKNILIQCETLLRERNTILRNQGTNLNTVAKAVHGRKAIAGLGENEKLNDYMGKLSVLTSDALLDSRELRSGVSDLWQFLNTEKR